MTKYLKIYADFLRKFLKPKTRIKAVFDCSNGTAGLVLKRIFAASLPRHYNLITAHFINDKPDGRFPAHGPDPLKPEALRDLRLAISRLRADLGVVFDADGDRVVFLDDLGQIVSTDAAVLLLARGFKGAVLLTPLSGFSAREELRRAGRRIIECRVGTYFIKKAMARQSIEFGAEISGHYYFKKFFYCDSGILAAIKMLNQISNLKNQKLSLRGWIDDLPKYYRKDVDIGFDLRRAASVLRRVENQYRGQAGKISHLDGLKMEFGSGDDAWWFNLRPSNTENLLRLTIEAKDKNIFKSRLAEITYIIETK